MRGSLRNWMEYVVAWPLLQGLQWLPLPLARGLAAGLGGLAHTVTPRWRAIADRNLRLAFPETSESRRKEIVRDVYRNLGRVLLSVARMPRIDQGNIGQWLEYEGYKHYDEARRRGRGVLYLTAHLGNWELSAHAHGLHGHPLHVVVRTLDNPYFDRFVAGRRVCSGNHVIRKQEFARRSIKAINAQEAVGALVDQNTSGEDGVFVDFFGHQASATSGIARLAMRTGAPVIPGFAFWDGERRKHVLRFSPPVPMVDTGDKEADLAENTQRCQRVIEEAIREHPEQWLWIHRRWKTRPSGEPDLYLERSDP